MGFYKGFTYNKLTLVPDCSNEKKLFYQNRVNDVKEHVVIAVAIFTLGFVVSSLDLLSKRSLRQFLFHMDTTVAMIGYMILWLQMRKSSQSTYMLSQSVVYNWEQISRLFITLGLLMADYEESSV